MKTVKLSRQYHAGSALFDKLEFAPPLLRHYRQHGKVAEYQRGVLVTYNDAIWAYADDLVKNINSGALAELDLVDALAVEGALIGFFTEAMGQLAKLATSSSASGGDQPTSTA